MTTACSNCGAPTTMGQTYCGRCGHLVGELLPDAKPPPKGVSKPDYYCTTCGAGVALGPAYCPNCGAPLPRELMSPPHRATPGSVGLQVFAILIFVFVGLPVGALGGCAVALAGSDAASLAFGGAALLVSALLLWFMVYAVRKK